MIEVCKWNEVQRSLKQTLVRARSAARPPPGGSVARQAAVSAHSASAVLRSVRTNAKSRHTGPARASNSLLKRPPPSYFPVAAASYPLKQHHSSTSVGTRTSLSHWCSSARVQHQQTQTSAAEIKHASNQELASALRETKNAKRKLRCTSSRSILPPFLKT